LESHLVVGMRALESLRDSVGRSPAAISVQAEFSEPIHEEWANAVGAVIPITKAIRREAWDFVEGFPTPDVYRATTCEDQFLSIALRRYFAVPHLPEATVRYWNYPGSSFDKQLTKFRRPYAESAEATEPDVGTRVEHSIRIEYELAFLRYLDRKWSELGWRERLSEFALTTV
jgi:hypothetical protein